MRKYTIRRIFMAVVTLLVVACLTFLLMNAIPGNPWLSEKSPSQATIDALNAKYGLDQPVPVQMVKYLGNILHGDFGTSIKMQKNRAVLSIILEMFPVSAKIGIIALLWAILVGVPLGCLAAFKRGNLGRQSPSYYLYPWYFHARIRSGNDFAAYFMWRYSGGEGIPGTV